MIQTAGKVRRLGEAITWRTRQIGPVVFTNGVFDIVHPGHVELLEAARREGAVLIVGPEQRCVGAALGERLRPARWYPKRHVPGFWPVLRRWIV